MLWSVRAGSDGVLYDTERSEADRFFMWTCEGGEWQSVGENRLKPNANQKKKIQFYTEFRHRNSNNKAIPDEIAINIKIIVFISSVSN